MSASAVTLSGPASRGLRRDLNAMTADAAAFSVMVGAGETYLAAFALAVGAGEVTAGLLASAPPLAGAVLQLATPRAVRRLRSHRRWVVICAALQAASFAPLVVAALVGSIPTAALFLIATFYWGTGMATGPAWNTWVGTVVPGRLRTRYFAFRTRVTQVGVLMGLAAAGLALQWGGERGRELEMFAAIFLGAGICRALSSRLLAITSEPVPMPQNYRHLPAHVAFPRLFRGSHEGRLLVYLLSVQAAVHLSAPYFTPYMLKQLDLSYGGYMGLVAASFGAKIVMLPALGSLARRFDARTLLWVGGLGIVPLSSLWLVSNDYRYLIGLQCVAGTMWAAWELATFLLVFETIAEDERTSVLTAFNLANAVAMVGGSILGGIVLHWLGEDHFAYMVIFASSSVLRLITVAFLRRVRTPTLRPVPIATRTVAVRPSDGSIDRPILPSLPPEEDDAGGGMGAGSGAGAGVRTVPPGGPGGLGGSSAAVPGSRSGR